jgi:two-component system chemotaxis response regulator CheB
MSDRSVHVLVVDDSAVVREAVRQVLARDRRFVVTVAADAFIAISKIERARPDVVLLDLAMPRMDGLSLLRRIMRKDPIPVVVCSALEGSAADDVARALEEGALDVVTKPAVGVRDFLHDSVTRLIDVLHGAASARIRNRAARRPSSIPRAKASSDVVIGIGASTGGPEALATVLRAMPSDAPPILVVQHMPAGFTSAFASRLDRSCVVEVKEAVDGDDVRPGRVLIAPGDRHMILARLRGRLCVRVFEGPLVNRHRPSVDVLFGSLAETMGSRAVASILTGMGNDGAFGLLAMKNAGAATIAQDEATSIVFGMPKEAIACGGASEIVPIDRIAGAMLEHAAARGASLAAQWREQ